VVQALTTARPKPGVLRCTPEVADLRVSGVFPLEKAITQYVEREEKREAFRQDTLKAWEEYRITGLHATAEEVDAWLASWGTDDERPAPECRK